MADSTGQFGEEQALLVRALVLPGTRTYPRSIREVLPADERDLILWLALHGINPREIAWVVHQEINRPDSMPRLDHVANIRSLVKKFIIELAWGEGGDENPNTLVSRLVQRDNALNWGRYRLERALFFADTDDDERAMDQLRYLQSEKRALARYRAKNNQRDPVPGLSKAHAALNGLQFEADVEQGLQATGYRPGSHVVEMPVMRGWLLRIRQAGGIPGHLPSP